MSKVSDDCSDKSVSINKLTMPLTMGAALLIGAAFGYGAYASVESEQDLRIQTLELEAAVHAVEASSSRVVIEQNLEDVTIMLRILTETQTSHDRRIFKLELSAE